MKKKIIITITLVIAIVLSYLPVLTLAETASLFRDMPAEDHWASEALKAAVSSGLIRGVEKKDGLYISPNNLITRAEIVAIVNRAFGAKEESSLIGVKDVDVDEWYYKDIQKAVKMGIIEESSYMRPKDPVTRQEAFTILGRALKMDSGSKEDFAKFKDSSQLADWAIPSVGAMVKAGYIKGSDNALNPKNNMTRAEFAVLMNNIKKQLDLSTEKAIRDYLQGEWTYDWNYYGDVVCKMNIDKDLNVDLSFRNSYSSEPKGDYRGKITFDRLYAKTDQAPDIISLELIDTDEPGGDFFFLHRTIYDGKRVMSWFYAGNGNSIFDVADSTEDFKYTTREAIFEKTSGERSQENPRKNDEFYAVYWGKGEDGKSIWLDDVWWTPEEDQDFEEKYPNEMTNYSTDIQESVLYSIIDQEILEEINNGLTKNLVYYIETDNQGNIKDLISADEKKWIEDNYITDEIREMVTSSLRMYDEPDYYLNLGMTILFEGDTVMINGEEYYEVVLGTQHDGDHFVREMFYAVNTYTGEVYWYDVLNDIWQPLGMG